MLSRGGEKIPEGLEVVVDMGEVNQVVVVDHRFHQPN